jgi:carbonic anhydrase/acetyltransferase-like protein (isoleucine patch superfamily)
LNHVLPTISKETFVAPSAELIGSVTLSNRSSVWYNAVLRGDLNTVLVGTGSSVEERSVLHAARSSPSGSVTGTTIGDYVRIGSGSVISSAVVDDGADIGERSVLCEGSMVERVAVLAPNSVLPPARRIPPGEVWGGNPAQFIRTLGEEEQAEMELRAERTFVNAQQHAFEFPENGMQYVQAEKVREMAQQVRNKNVSTGSSSIKE